MKARSKSGIVLLLAIGLAGGSALFAGNPRNKPSRARDLTVRGRLVDLRTYMTGKSSDENSVKGTQDNFRAGVPAGIETEEGLVLVGSADRGPARMIVPLAMQQVEAKGKLYEREGLKYLDMLTIQAQKGGGAEEVVVPGEEEHEVTEEHHAKEDQPPPADEPDASEDEQDEEP